MHKINHANIKEWARNYDGPLFDGILCDPPYELGFMGKSWDSSGIAFDKDMWADLLRILKPGGHLLAFSGSRTYHRMAVAIEDAGFEIRDMIEWVYGSGFPKSLNIGKSVNQLETNEWTKIGKALDNIQKTDIIRVWKSNSNNVNIVAELSQRPATEAGTHTDLSDSALLSVVLPTSQEKQNTSVDTVEIALSVHQATPTRTNTVLQNVVAEIKQLQKPVKFAEILSLSQNHKHSTTSTAQESVKDTPSENTANKIRVEEALKTLRGKKKYSDEETINAICAVLTENLLHTILSQSKTFQSLDTTSKTECASAITVTITEYMAECLTTYTVGIAKGKAVDKIQGNEREVTGIKEQPLMTNHYGKGLHNERPIKELEETKGTSPYEGYGTALKPAHEPCVLARKPIEGTVANNVLKHGTGGLNIDGTRVGTDQAYANAKGNSNTMDSSKDIFVVPNKLVRAEPNTLGRFPSNLILDGSDEVEAVFPQTGGGKYSKQTRQRKGFMLSGSEDNVQEANAPDNYGDSGSASRFFFTAKPDLYCSLCYGIMEVCENNAQNAQTTSQLGTQASNTAQNNVVVRQAQEPKDKQPNKTNNAHNVVSSSASTSQTTESTAQPNVTQNLKELLDLAAKYAGIQCLKCQTSIAQRLVVMATENMESQVCQGFITDYKNSTQTENLVSTVAYLANIDITQTTINLTKLCGFAHLATGENTKQVNLENNKGIYRLKYQSKASKSERNAGLEGFEEKSLKGFNASPREAHGEVRDVSLHTNPHPTVKPLSLTKYLATLIKPPTGGRLLVPFSGSGSEMIGALQAGWEYVEGVELTEEYIPIAEARIKYWLEQAGKEQISLL